jgi:hypothetical protein
MIIFQWKTFSKRFHIAKQFGIARAFLHEDLELRPKITSI